MVVEEYIEPKLKYIVLSINFEHKEYGNQIRNNTKLEKDGYSCCWKIAKNRTIDKVLLYIKNNSQKEIYIGDYKKREQCKDGKYKIYFSNLKLIDKIQTEWKDFVNNGVQLQTARKYIEKRYNKT